MDILAKARKLESKLAQTIDRTAQQWSQSGPRGPLEVLHGVLAAVDERMEPAGRGTHVFPFNQINVSVVADSRDTRTRFSGVLDSSPSLREKIATRLRNAGCDVPGLQVRIVYVTQPEPAWDTPEFHVDFDRAQVTDPPPPPSSGSSTPWATTRPTRSSGNSWTGPPIPRGCSRLPCCTGATLG